VKDDKPDAGEKEQDAKQNARLFNSPHPQSVALRFLAQQLRGQPILLARYPLPKRQPDRGDDNEDDGQFQTSTFLHLQNRGDCAKR
jgi:hypothetical protein